MTKRTRRYHAKSLRKSETQEVFQIRHRPFETLDSLFLCVSARALRCCGKPNLGNIVSIVTLCDLRVKGGARG